MDSGKVPWQAVSTYSAIAATRSPEISAVPDWLVALVRAHAPGSDGRFAAQLLWQRGWRNREAIHKFLDFTQYAPSSAFCFSGEMERACDRILQAQQNQEKIAIWGDFDADGITATAVLWEGLGHWFEPHDGPEQRLIYHIPNRLTDSHGLNLAGLEQLRAWGATLVITCDTGSGDGALIAQAKAMGMDTIVTDHHSLPSERPEVVAIVNPRSLAPDHPLADLSGVAVAYKLIEALHQRLPADPVSDPTSPPSERLLSELLPLVAIGLIADLVALRGDCRYLAQVGLVELQKLRQPFQQPSRQSSQQRPGVAYLLERCQRTGDRPTDIAFGIGPRINAVSRIQGDARLCVELLTSRDAARCKALVDQVELLNTRRKALQRDLERQVKAKLTTIDLSTTGAIVLWETGWPVGVLGLVAGQIAREYGKPTVLLSLAESPIEGLADGLAIARGSARSINDINFYPLLESQRHLLTSFGGHPMAAGLSLPAENLALFAQGLNQALRAQSLSLDPTPPLQADLTVTVADLGQPLFRELKLLEPYGMGNPAPKLLIQNCHFENATNFNIKDWRGGSVRYIKTIFELKDATSHASFPGLWWGHYRDELPEGLADVIGELDVNVQRQQYEFRLVAVRPAAAIQAQSEPIDWILDWRRQRPDQFAQQLEPQSSQSSSVPSLVGPVIMETQPQQWSDFGPWIEQAQSRDRPLALAYGNAQTDAQTDAQTTWATLLGIAKYLSRTGESVAIARLEAKLGLDLRRDQGRLMGLAGAAIAALGFDWSCQGEEVCIGRVGAGDQAGGQVGEGAIARFLGAIQEIAFQRRYFEQVPVAAVAQRARDWAIAPSTERP